MAILISKYQLLEEVYTNSTGSPKTKQLLEEALETLYVALLNYQVCMVLYVQSRRERLKAPFISEAASLPRVLLDNIKQLEDEVAKQAAMSSAETVVSTFAKVSDLEQSLRSTLEGCEKAMKKMYAGLEQVSKVVESNYRNQVLNWISRIRFETSHDKVSEGTMPGTTEWIVLNDQYQAWRSLDESSGLWLRGPMGTGKSYLAHAVIEDRKKSCSELGPSLALAYFYCDGAELKEDARHQLSSENILACITKQILMHVADTTLPEPAIKLYESNYQKTQKPTEVQCIKLISDVLAQLSVLTLILDGLDECPLPVQSKLLLVLQKVCDGSQALTKIFVSSRDEGDIKRMLGEWLIFNRSRDEGDGVPRVVDGWLGEHINIVEHTNVAINEVIIQTVTLASEEEPLRSRCYGLRDGKQRQESVIEVLQSNAGGMFRWVRIAISYLYDAESYEEMKERLGELDCLPELFDLNETMYQKMMSAKSKAGQRKAKAIETALNLLLHGRAGQSGKEKFMMVIVEACAFAANGSRSEPYRTDELVALCPSFLVLAAELDKADHEDTDTDTNTDGDTDEDLGSNERVLFEPGRRLYFPHFSVKEFLLERHAGKYSERAGHAYLASLCMEAFNDYGMSHENNGRTFVEYSSFHCIDYIYLENQAQQRNVDKQGEDPEALLLRYQKALAKFLPLAGPHIGFTEWHTYMSRRSESKKRLLESSVSQSAYTHQATPLFARILLNQDLSSATISSAELETTFVAPPRGQKASHPISALSFAAYWGRFEAVKWLHGYSGSHIHDVDRATLALSDIVKIEHFGLFNTDLNEMEDFKAKESLVRVVEFLLDNGARITPKEILFALRFEGEYDTAEALAKVIHQRQPKYLIDEADRTMIDFLIEYQPKLAKNNFQSSFQRRPQNFSEDLYYGWRIELVLLDYLPSFLEHGFKGSYRNRWLQGATGKMSLAVVTLLIDGGADPLAPGIRDQSSVDVAESRVRWNIKSFNSLAGQAVYNTCSSPLEEEDRRRTERDLRASLDVLQYLAKVAQVDGYSRASCKRCTEVSRALRWIKLEANSSRQEELLSATVARSVSHTAAQAALSFPTPFFSHQASILVTTITRRAAKWYRNPFITWYEY